MIKVIEDKEYGYILELWGASTKHPDSRFFFKDFKKNDFIEDKYQIYQWLLECASKLTWPFYAKELVDYANENWYNWND